MLNMREYGIIFQKNNDCGIAKVAVFNNTLNMYISETNAQSATPVYRYVDLYQAASPAYNTLEQKWTYWISLIEGDSYTITVVNSATHNPLASSPYNVSIYGFLQADPLIISDLIENELTTYHSDFPSETYPYTLTDGTSIETYKEQPFNGDQVIKLFTLSGNNHAAEFYKFSVNSGASWRYPNDPYITWGSNSPSYDNETIDTDYQFTINFMDAPPIGTNNVIIKYLPKTNSAYFKLTMKQPHDLSGYKDIRPHVAMTDYGIEFIS